MHAEGAAAESRPSRSCIATPEGGCIESFFVVLQGYSEAEIENTLRPLKQRALHLPNGASFAITRAEEFPETRVRQRSPPDLPPELLQSLRMGATRLFKVFTLSCLETCMTSDSLCAQ